MAAKKAAAKKKTPSTKKQAGAPKRAGTRKSAPPSASGEESQTASRKKRWHKRRYRNSRRLLEASSSIDRTKTYGVEEGFELLKSLSAVKFDETVECVVRLGIDPKKTDQLVRGAVGLPHGIGKKVRVIAFAEGDKADDAKQAGAAAVGSEDLAKRIQDGWMDFDVVIASPDMMKHVGRLGRVLGPQGKMPSPKAGTVTADVGKAVEEFVAGKIEFRTDSGANVHAPIGKRSFSAQKLADNARALVGHLKGLKPAQAKGAFILKVCVSSTMGPGIRVDLSEGGSHA